MFSGALRFSPLQCQRHGAADLGQVQAHRRGVADGHDQSRAQRQVMAFFRPMRAFRRRTGFLPRRDRCLARA